MTKLIRPSHIAEKIIFVDGVSGNGKSMLGPILGSFKNVEKIRFEHVYEYLCILNHFKKIDTDAAVTLMRMFADLAIYNSMISREVNLRIFDDSGLLNNPHPLRYIARLFYKDGDEVLCRIKNNSPILQLMTHQVLPAIELAFEAYGKRLRIIEMIRHPLYLIDHWLSYIERYGKDPREFTLWFDYNGKAVPWFAYGWEGSYLASQPIDKVIYSINWLIEQTNNAYQILNDEQKKQIIFIPFEKFVKDPWPFIKKLETFLGADITLQTKKVLRKQRCPRECLSAGRGHKKYGWKKPSGGIDDLADYKRRRVFVVNNASKEAIELLDKLSVQYEQEYDITF